MSENTKVQRRPQLNSRLAVEVLVFVVASVFWFGTWVRYRDSEAKIDRAIENQERAKAVRANSFLVSFARQPVLSVLRQCAKASDIPSLRGKYIVSVGNLEEQLVLYVPDGQHELEIECTRSDGDANSEKRSWRVPLVAESGYLFRLNVRTKDQPPSWEITSNDTAFRTQTETIFREPFWQSASSSTVNPYFQLPNQTDPTAAFIPRDPPALKLLDKSFQDSTKGKESTLTFTVHLRSKNDPHCTWKERWKISTPAQEQRVMAYRGDGAYTLGADGN